MIAGCTCENKHNYSKHTQLFQLLSLLFPKVRAAFKHKTKVWSLTSSSTRNINVKPFNSDIVSIAPFLPCCIFVFVFSLNCGGIRAGSGCVWFQPGAGAGRGKQQAWSCSFRFESRGQSCAVVSTQHPSSLSSGVAQQGWSHQLQRALPSSSVLALHCWWVLLWKHVKTLF